MDRWGIWVAQHARLVLLMACAVLVAAAVYGMGVFAALSEGGFEDPASDSSKYTARVTEVFGPVSNDVSMVFTTTDGTVTDPDFAAQVQGVLAELPSDVVAAKTSFYSSGNPGLVSADQKSTLVLVTLVGDTETQKVNSYFDFSGHIELADVPVTLAGPFTTFEDATGMVIQDITRAELIAIPIVFLLSIVIFGSLVAATMPVVVGIFAVVGALAVVRLVTGFTDVSVFSINIITVLGMGLAVDYALFMVSRFREESATIDLSDRAARAAAVQRTLATAGRTVAFSALVVAGALSALAIFPQSFLSSMAWGGSAAVLVAMLTAVTVLPAILMVLGPRLNYGTVPFTLYSYTKQDQNQGFWVRLAHAVMRRPVAFLLAATTLLVSLGAPFLGVSWGGIDERVLPAEASSRLAAELVKEKFTGDTVTGQVLVEGADPADLPAYLARLGQIEGVQGAAVVRSSSAPAAALVQVQWSGIAMDERSQQVVRSLRAVTVPDGAAVLFGGASAQTVDLVDSVLGMLPWMGLITAGIMLVLLFWAFGSFVLPLKAVLMSVISLGASFGVVTWIFADGHLHQWLNFTPMGYLDVTQPILLLAIVFGLSMDYEVFLLSRVREEWDRTGDNQAAVAHGMQRSGHIITSAAVLLAVVIGAFSMAQVQSMQLIGVGMLVAVILDATIVRGILVPATMRLLGAWNWWAPASVAAWWQRHGHHEGSSARTTAVGDADDSVGAAYADEGLDPFAEHSKGAPGQSTCSDSDRAAT